MVSPKRSPLLHSATTFRTNYTWFGNVYSLPANCTVSLPQLGMDGRTTKQMTIHFNPSADTAPRATLCTSLSASTRKWYNTL